MVTAIYNNALVPDPYSLPQTGCFTPRKIKVSMNKSAYRVGEVPTYFVTGATPDGPIIWSSTLNGVDSGENDSYGQYTDANGNWSGHGGTWTGSYVGTWTKTVHIGSITRRPCSLGGTNQRWRLIPLG